MQVAIHRPFPGEVFDVGTGVTLYVQIFDFDLPTLSGHNRTGDGILSLSLCVSAYLWLCTLCLRENTVPSNSKLLGEFFFGEFSTVSSIVVSP